MIPVRTAGMLRSLLLLGCGLLLARAADAAQEQRIAPLVQVDVIVELDAVNESLRSTSHSIGEISESIRLMAESGQLSPDEQEQLSRVLENLDTLVETSADSVNALPSLVQRLRTSVLAHGNELLDDLKLWSVIIIFALFALLILMGVGFYFLVLRPLQDNILSTIANVSKIASALEDTSKALEANNAIQRKLLEAPGRPEFT
jgi:predicted unusual protein kinase regulating ubiquinone biosynthesis (AarF/ABC1/UbiB family)